MIVDVELEVVPFDDRSERDELHLRSLNERKGDDEVHALVVQSPRVDRSFESGSDDRVEDFECLRQLHRVFNANWRSSVSARS